MVRSVLASLFLLVILPFSGKGQFVLNGSASTTSSACSATTYELTPDLGGEGGQIWYSTLYSLANPLDVQFQIFLGTKAYSTGADGIGFVFQPLSSSAGSVGGGMGFGGISPSVDVEFDTYKNGWDPAFCHIAVEKNGDVDHTVAADLLAGPVQCSPTNPTIPDGAWHSARIMWNPKSKTLKVYFDCSLRVTYTGDIINNVFAGNPNVYWGFTAGTGGAENLQEVCITHTFIENLRDTVICKGSSVNMTASGGVTYSWTPAAGLNTTTGATVIATPAATTKYYVTITDACGISIQDSETIRVSNTVLTTSGTNTTCGNSNGTASVTAAGGIGAYTYTWSNGQTSTSMTGLSSGTYNVTSKDSLGCTATATEVISGSPQLRDSIVSFTNVSVACGSNGTANAGVKGGTTPYTYAWSDGQTATNATNLSAGVYTFTVTDANGCTANTTVTISQPGALTASITGTTPALCNGGATGTASGTVTGGNPAYTYSWSNGETGTTATALTAGVYTFSVTDANGCTVTATATVTQPSILRDSISASSNISCNGGNDGTATVGVEGGSSPYTYAWSNTGTTSAITALTAGTYNVNVTDANGCPGTASVTLTQPPVLSLTSGAFNATCFNVCNGQASVIPAGGTPPYSYSWSTGATTAALLNLCIGTYTITVTDAKGCQHDTSLTIAQPPQIVITKNPPTTAHCNQADGSGSVSAAGGTGALTYLWSNGQTGTNITNVKPGSYCVTVTDANGCTDTACIVVPNQLGVIASITTTTNVTCNGGNDGSITGNATSGTAPYIYSWNTVPPQLTATATNLTAGSYTLTVTDATGCTDTAVATITQPALVVATTSAPVTICIGQTATLTATAVGGTSPYTFTWSNGTTASSDPVTPATTTTYTVNTVDVNGCPGAPVPVVVTVNPALSVVAGAPQAMCPGGIVNLSATGSGGDGVYTYTWNPITVPATGSPVTANPAVTTIYTVTVQDGCGTPQATATETVT
ncbi:MAG TPA: hypothetical protein VK806_10210, partial [Bacteroidia bacterium]|nr:hypothetical protein [Bacteroidia bacterium]